ncbi:hypothetical protein H5410_052628 [Solanum commersonii]|uniref:Pectinesterase inhibitor domain-containing protein n=1 Tax=Solanum commersonii TaxID=4109 RepID=A0A9J5X1C2_SOLCO|nr:hypothetical protein H5410_052628 [Solanum commersonii]
MNFMKTLIVFLVISLLELFSSGDLIEYVCRTSNDFKTCINSLRADLKKVFIKDSIYNEIVSLLKQAKELVLKECLKIGKINYDELIDVAITSIKFFDANNSL